MHCETNKKLTNLHTFGVTWDTRLFYALTSDLEIKNIIQYSIDNELDIFILGGGSNILPVYSWNGLVIHNQMTGRVVVEHTTDSVVVDIASGEDWHSVVCWSIRHGYYGLENLSCIPGTIGGAVVQNIGAYDVDIAQYVQSVEVAELTTGKRKFLTQNECQFTYRNSIFKTNIGMYMVVKIRLKLDCVYRPILTYPSLQKKIENTLTPSAKSVAQAIASIRRSALPDWNILGTAGSFFANPQLDQEDINQLQSQYPNIPVFTKNDGQTCVVPAGWLIQNSQLDDSLRKQFLYAAHSLIVVNTYKHDTNIPDDYGLQIYQATETIRQQVQKDFGINLRTEVVVLQ